MQLENQQHTKLNVIIYMTYTKVHWFLVSAYENQEHCVEIQLMSVKKINSFHYTVKNHSTALDPQQR